MTWFGPLSRRFGVRGLDSRRAVRQQIHAIRETASHLTNQSECELRAKADDLRERIFQGTPPSDERILVPGFALMNEAIRRTLGFTYYDVQLFAGRALAQGMIAEMQTGEGKTLVAALPAFVHGLTGKGVHIITANAYLAKRDCIQLAPAFECLGLSATLLPERVGIPQKQPAYQSDITYGTGYEFGFDYLRDQVTLRDRAEAPLGQSVLEHLAGWDDESQFLQRGLPFAIIDEIDSVLIDDANSPLVLSEQSAPHAEDGEAHQLARSRIANLENHRDYVLDAASGSLQLTDAGIQKIHADIQSVPFKVLKRPWAEYIKNALRAEMFFRRNVQYIIQDNRVQLVDESTGRIFEDRHWRDGLHQAVEAKEELTITSEKLPLAQITRQRFFRLYEGLCGMTGTATGSEGEFSTFYDLSVIPIPLRKPSRRELRPTRYFANVAAKWQAVVRTVRDCQERGQPVLIGTRTISASNSLSDCLTTAGIEHQLLNGCQNGEEAGIIARAGEPGTVTIATNMAGRGTDIKPPFESLKAGGLHVIVTERHDSNRVDRQLIGRSARQGEPGSAQCFLSAEDDLISRHQPRLGRVMQKSADAQGEVFLAVTSMVDRIQRRIEQAQYQQRRDLFRYDQYREGVLGQIHGSD